VQKAGSITAITRSRPDSRWRLNPLKETYRSHYARLAVLSLCVIILVNVAKGDYSAQSDMADMQSRSGQLIAQLEDRSIKVILFDRLQSISVPLAEGVRTGGGAISSNGEEIAFQQIVPSDARPDTDAIGSEFERFLSVAQVDGTNLRQFSSVKEPTSFCWSPNRDRLAYVGTTFTGAGIPASHPIQLLDLRSGKITVVDDSGTISTQCFNPQSSALVFERGGKLWIHDLESQKSRFITNGANATWSPDGGLISYRWQDAYYAIEPSGSGAKVLLKKKDALTALWWSPDSQYVAYVVRPGLWKTSTKIPDELDLRVMRLNGGEERTVYRFPGKGRPIGFQWVKNAALLDRAKAENQTR